MSYENPLLNEREKTHGDFTFNAHISQSIKNVLRDAKYERLSVWQREALDMIAHKIGRIIAGNADEPDHWRDIAGYADLARENSVIPAGLVETE